MLTTASRPRIPWDVVTTDTSLLLTFWYLPWRASPATVLPPRRLCPARSPLRSAGEEASCNPGLRTPKQGAMAFLGARRLGFTWGFLELDEPRTRLAVAGFEEAVNVLNSCSISRMSRWKREFGREIWEKGRKLTSRIKQMQTDHLIESRPIWSTMTVGGEFLNRDRRFDWDRVSLLERERERYEEDFLEELFSCHNKARRFNESGGNLFPATKKRISEWRFFWKNVDRKRFT